MENTPQQTSEGTAVVRVLATVLERLVKANANLSAPGQGQVTKFHALKAPGISILQYLERIYKYASCSTECFILALIYIDRLIQKHNFVLTELNVHRVVITSILLAAKFFDDAYYNNAYYAKVGGVLVSEMNGLEVEFLFRINFSLHVKPDEFAKYQANLVSHAVGSDESDTTPVGVSPCTYTDPCGHSLGVSQPPSPQPMSSQSTSPSMSPRNESPNEDVYEYNPAFPAWTECNKTHKAVEQCAQDKQFYDTSAIMNPQSNQSYCARETMLQSSQNKKMTMISGNQHQGAPSLSQTHLPLNIPGHSTPHVNLNVYIQQNGGVLSEESMSDMTSRRNQAVLPSTQNQILNVPHDTQGQVTPSPPQGHFPAMTPHQTASHVQLNMYVQQNGKPLSAETVQDDSFHSFPPHETRFSSLLRYNSYPYGIHSKSQAQNLHIGNSGTYPLTGDMMQNKQSSNISTSKDAIFSRCAYYRQVNKPISCNVGNIT